MSIEFFFLLHPIGHVVWLLTVMCEAGRDTTAIVHRFVIAGPEELRHSVEAVRLSDNSAIVLEH